MASLGKLGRLVQRCYATPSQLGVRTLWSLPKNGAVPSAIHPKNFQADSLSKVFQIGDGLSPVIVSTRASVRFFSQSSSSCSNEKERMQEAIAIAKERLSQTKSNWDPENSWREIEQLMHDNKDVWPILNQMGIASMSWGALSLEAVTTMSFAANAMAATQAGYGYSLETYSDFLKSEHNGFISRSGEGGVYPPFAGTPFGPRSVQYSGGGNVPKNFLEYAKDFELKLGQAAKVWEGGMVSLIKVLQDPDLAKARGLAPESFSHEDIRAYADYLQSEFDENPQLMTTIAAQNAMNYSVEELTEFYRMVLLINPDLINSLTLKVPYDGKLPDSIFALLKTMHTAKESTENSVNSSWLKVATGAGGTGNTKAHLEAHAGSILEATVACHEILAKSTGTSIGLIVDGSLMNSSQLFKLFLINCLYQTKEGTRIPFKANLGTAQMWPVGGIQLDKCNKPWPNGCSVGVASSHPEDLKNFTGKPEDSAFFNIALAKGVRRLLIEYLGVESFDDVTAEMAERVLDLPISVSQDREVVSLENRVSRSFTQREPDIFPSIQSRFLKEASSQIDLGQIEVPRYFGATADQFLKDFESVQIKVNPQNIPVGLGAYLPNNVSLSVNGDCDQGTARWSRGEVNVNGKAGYGFAEGAKWGSVSRALLTGKDAAKILQGGRLSVCQLGDNALECARAGDIFVFGGADHYPEYQLSRAHYPKDSQTLELNNIRWIGAELGVMAPSFRLFTPRLLSSELPEDLEIKSLSESDIDILWKELQDYSKAVGKAVHIKELVTDLASLSETERKDELQRLFVKAVKGRPIQDFLQEQLD